MSWLEVFVYSILIPISLSELTEVSPWIAKRILNKVSKSLPETYSTRYLNEWLAELDAVPGKIAKLAWALSIYINLPRIFSEACAGTYGHGPPSSYFYARRLLDLAIVLPALLPTIPVLFLLAWWVRLVSHSSPFFTQTREGFGGKPINILKLRTMYPDAEQRLERHLAENPEAKAEWERSYKLKRDPRILPGVGYFLRKTSLDELPQLFNVVRGEMSLVGPRPFPAYHLERFSPEFRELRHSVLPGITGFWQVLARSDSDLKLQEELDTYYIRNWSPWLDIYLLFRTVMAVLGSKGAY